MPKISVIVPVYKVEQYLCRCIDSILGQTFSDFELILVDDGSPDNCGKICDEYAAKDERIHVIHQENGGLSAARNTGIDWAFDNSDSEWISFIDSDDWVHKEYLEALLAAAEITKLPVSIVSIKRVRDEIDIDELSFAPTLIEIHNTEEFFCKRDVEATVAWGKIYRKELFRNMRYPVGKIHEDEFLTYKIIFQCPQIAYLPLTMYWYYQNPNGIMNSKWSLKRLDNVDALREQLSFFKENNYPRAYEARVRSFAILLTQSISELKKTDDRKRNLLIRKLRKEMRTLLKRNRSAFRIDSEPGKGYYYLAYPIEMKVRRFFQRKLIAVRNIWKSKGIIGVLQKIFRR